MTELQAWNYWGVDFKYSPIIVFLTHAWKEINFGGKYTFSVGIFG